MSGNASTSDPTIEPEDGTSTTPATEADDAAPDPAAMGTPPGEHSSELPGDNDGDPAEAPDQEANAEESEQGQPSQ
ncbi:hypothetical protein ENKNEFLB_03958 [Nocardioides aquaticus]|uniref:Uncharacterized protein n=1 Tax=Nocardioides aquaticus TaxID=160826 RepID=A0ABX8EQB0_9ACTN|nr:hypothetical protein [Nocardioides aquaticus]QVT81548.1 hypothetical protein ENKNEFLB_03958 [Nocardioides aquaticus]